MKQKWAFALSVGLLLILSSVSFPFSAIADAPVNEPKDGNTIYHTYGELTAELQAIAFANPSIAQLTSIGQSWEGRELWCMKISDNVAVDEDEPEVYINGCHHSREWMALEVPYYFIVYLVENYTTDPTAQYLVDNREIFIIPLVNPDGREYDGAGPGDIPSTNNDWRKNRRDNGDGTWGVDLNRNYGYMWGVAGAAGATNEITYAGPGPFSEPETQAARDFVSNRSFVTSISYHSYSQLIIWPWGCFYEKPPDSVVLRALGNAMSDNITNTAGSVQGQYTPEQASLLYPTSGGDIDWLYADAGILSYVIELYPSGSDSMSDRFHPPANKVVPVVLDNIPGMICLSMAAGDPYMVMDHVTLTPEPESQLVNQDITGYFTVSALNDGLRDDVFDLSVDAPPGWATNFPASVSLARNESQNLTLSVTVPTFEVGGDYHLWINATSQTNSTCKYGTSVIVTVPFYNDTAIISHSPFEENGQYPQGNINMRATVMNYGQMDLGPFDLSCTISQLGSSTTTTVFSENFEIDLSQWNIIDHDGSHSSSSWKRNSDSHGGSWGAWCGSSTQYTDTTIQSLETAVPIDLREASGANLSFWHRYDIEEDWDFGTIEVSGDGGQTWSMEGRYTGVYNTWHLETIDLGNFAGSSDVILRFFFTSDGGVTAPGWHIDDVLITADQRSETIIWGPTPEPTPGILYQNDTLECSWLYTFTPGHYKATYETMLATDERADNDMMDVVFEIIPATLPDVVVTQPNSGEVWDVGTSQTITWSTIPGSYPLTSNPISIYYSTNGSGGPYNLIADNEADDGTYTWDPIPNTPSSNCWLLIDAEDDQGFVGSDVSDVSFSIQADPPVVLVTYPNGGESLMGGSSSVITWTATGGLIINPMTIEYSTTGPAGPWIPIASDEPNDGAYTWNPVPAANENNCYVRIRAEDNLGFFGEDLSDASFFIDSTAPLPATNPRAELDGTGVRIYWDASPSADVDHYDVYWIMNVWDSTGDTYSNSINAGLNTDVLHANVGVNNPSSYVYQVRTYDAAGHEARTTIQAAKYGSTQAILAREPDWFLLSSPLVQSDTSLGHVIQGFLLPANMDYLRAYDADAGVWLSYNPVAPSSINTLTDINTNQGFWMHVTGNSRFATAGYVEDKSITLYDGWNLVAYPFAQRSTTTANIMSHLAANCPGYDAMLIEDLTTPAPYHLKTPAGTETISHNMGFWVHVTADTTWTIINYT